MNIPQQLIFIDGKNRTSSIESVQLLNGRYQVSFRHDPEKKYAYGSARVAVYPLLGEIDLSDTLVFYRCSQLFSVCQIFNYREYYLITFSSGRPKLFKASDIEVQSDCLSSADCSEKLHYFAELADAVTLTADDSFKILPHYYQKISSLSSDTALAKYFDPESSLQDYPLPTNLIFPFGLNQSQKAAVEKALSSQVSIIQGPPGTGKTQTILTLLSNLILNGKTAAVVSSNNSATLNVIEKLDRQNLSFLTAFLGKRENLDAFLTSQTGHYPDMSSWALSLEELERLKAHTSSLLEELNQHLFLQNRLAEIEQELLQLQPEQHYFDEYYEHSQHFSDSTGALNGFSSKKILSLWFEIERAYTSEKRLSILQKISILFRFNFKTLRLFLASPLLIIPYLQHEFYTARLQELLSEKESLQNQLADYSFDAKYADLSQSSLKLFRAVLAERYDWQNLRKIFSQDSLSRNPVSFLKEYPILLSTTYSIKNVLSGRILFDYLIIDEASQVDLATGVLALSCAKNVVIVGDLQQLPNVVSDDTAKKSDLIWCKYHLPEAYHFSNHSLLSSAVKVWPQAPVTLLREHYRCHPKIIEFCNQEFYHGELVVMTKDHHEPNVLQLYKTVSGNHARGHHNQRQIDVIKTEVLPTLSEQDPSQIAIIAPYRDQVHALRTQLGSSYEIDTIHKFQGREKNAVILTSVDNTLSSFVDDPNMLNVAVSRAVRSLTVITSQDSSKGKSYFGDLERYIEYNNFSIVQSQVYSVFDLLYKGYELQRQEYFKSHPRPSEYDSENLIYGTLQTIFQLPEFSLLSCALHVSLASLVRDTSLLTSDELRYVQNDLTHVDFLVFHKLNKQPLLAIEVDGVQFHLPESVQWKRDQMKNLIFQKIHFPLLRISTDGSSIEEKICDHLRTSISEFL